MPATSVNGLELVEARAWSESGGVRMYERAYRAPMHSTLVIENLELGDALPDVATAEILQTSRKFATDKRGPCQIITVKARAFLPWEN